MNYRDALWREVKRAAAEGGEVRITFIIREKKRIPIIRYIPFIETRCDIETIVEED